MSLAVGGLNLYNTNSLVSGLVSGAELEQVASEIFKAAASTQTTTTSNFNQVLTQTNNLFGTQNLDTIRQMATARTGFDVNLSDRATSAIESLRAEAAKLQFSSVSKTNGQIHIPSEIADFSDVKDVFAADNRPRLFEMSDLESDRKGPSPFFVANNSEKKEKEEKSLSIFA